MNIHGSMCISRPAWAQQRPARGHCTKQVACRAVASGGRPTVSSPPDEVDILVVGSGVGGLSAASLLAKYGAKVAVVEAHNAPGGAAHHWSRGPFSFDSGAALFSGINPLTPEEAKGADLTTANPLSSVLAALGEQVPDVVDMPDSATCLIYPDGKQYRCQMGSKAFVDVVQERHGSEAARQWREFQAEVDRLCATAGAVAPAAVRLDDGVGITVVFRRPVQFMQYLFGSSGTSSKSFGDIMDEHVTDPNVRELITMITEGTTSAAPAEMDATYMLRAFHEMWSQNTVLQYPAGGSQAIIDTLVKGLEKNGGTLSLRTRARRVLRGVDSDSSSDSSKSSDTSGGGATSSSKPSNAESLLGGVKRMLQSAMGGSSSGDPLDTAVAVEVVGPDGCPKVVKVRQAVISNASVWDTERILTTTGEVKHDSLSTPKVAERVLQQAAARGAEQEASAAVQREGASGARGASQLTAVESVESDGSGSTQTAAAVLDRLNGSIRLSSNKRDSFDSQSLRNPADAATASSEGVLDSMGSIDSDDWTNSESCSWEAPVGQDSKWLREDFLSYVRDLEMNASMMHLHVGFEAREEEDLPVHTYFLESKDCGSNGWPTIVIPSVTAPGLAPEGHHVLHATFAEDFEPWMSLARGSREYNTRKEERAELLWSYVRKLIPDIDERVKVTCIGTPLSHARFLRRKCGTYGPANLLNLTGALPKAVQPLENVWCCGDSVFPGVGTPAVAANGMWVANTLVPIQRHMQMLDDLGL